MKSGQIVVGAVLVSVAAALAAYVVNVVGTSVASSREASHAASEWAEDHDALVDLADRLELPATYTPVSCGDDTDSRCWHTARTARQAATDMHDALTSAGVDDAAVRCVTHFGVEEGRCQVSAPFGKDRLLLIEVQPPIGDHPRDAAAVAAAGIDVTLLIPAL